MKAQLHIKVKQRCKNRNDAIVAKAAERVL
jgi:hypothetical protein